MKLTAIVLAAGESRRMGRPKMGLTWGKTSVIGQVVMSLLQGGVDHVVVVTGGNRTDVLKALADLPDDLPVLEVTNPDYQQGDMVRSLQVGLVSLKGQIDAALVALGDQPQIQVEVVRQVLEAYAESRPLLVVPSYKLHRGHPWLVDHHLWAELLNLKSNETLRDFLKLRADVIHYVEVDTPSILQDLDTPDDYARLRPE